MNKDRIIMVKRILEGKTPNEIKKQKVVEALNHAGTENGVKVNISLQVMKLQSLLKLTILTRNNSVPHKV